MNFLILDTETTKLIPNSLASDKHQPRVIEFYGHIVTEKGEQLEELDFLCHPGHKLEPITTKITGITDEMLQGAPPFKHFAPQVKALIEKADGAVAHNLAYDFSVINIEMRRCNLSVKWPRRKICTVEQSELIKGHRLNLSVLHEYLFGEPFADAHRAKTDVLALTKCFLKMREMELV